MVKNGKAKNGTQTYLCKTCGRRSHPDAKPVVHSEATRMQIFGALHERMSLRGVQRVFDMYRNTVWLWVALARSTRRVLAWRRGGPSRWVVGGRSQETAIKLWNRLPLMPEQRLKGTFCTDLWAAYNEPLLGVKRVTRKGQTNHALRLNCTLRQQVGRLVRKSLSSSKSDETLDAALTLAFHPSNLSR